MTGDPNVPFRRLRCNVSDSHQALAQLVAPGSALVRKADYLLDPDNVEVRSLASDLKQKMEPIGSVSLPRPRWKVIAGVVVGGLPLAAGSWLQRRVLFASLISRFPPLLWARGIC